MSDPVSWWRDALAMWRRPSVGRTLQSVVILGGATGATSCMTEADVRPPQESMTILQREGDVDVTLSAVEVQRRGGWDVGAPDRPVTWQGVTPTDIDGSPAWGERIVNLTQAMAPRQPTLWPWYAPTLMQSLAGPDGELRAMMTPIHTPEMDVAYAKGTALASLFAEQGWPTDTAVVIDLPGPQSVAFAAALAQRFDPVFDFDNWPHPAGVVPSHETLGALIYFQPLLERASQERTLPAAPLFVLDSNRLNAYVDNADQFDNRYVAKLPPPDALQRLGVRHVLYINADGAPELDDLNEALCAITQSGTADVKELALSDFTQNTPDATIEDAVAGDELLYAGEVAPPLLYFYGGSWRGHRWFWNHYGWYPTAHRLNIAAPPRLRVTRGFAHVFAPRTTLFSARGLSTGVGHMSVQIARSSGRVMGFSGRTGTFAARSGSFGRASGFSSG